MDALEALGLKDCTFSSQTREIDSSLLSVEVGVAAGSEAEEGTDDGMFDVCDSEELGEGTV